MDVSFGWDVFVLFCFVLFQMQEVMQLKLTPLRGSGAGAGADFDASGMSCTRCTLSRYLKERTNLKCHSTSLSELDKTKQAELWKMQRQLHRSACVHSSGQIVSCRGCKLNGFLIFSPVKNTVDGKKYSSRHKNKNNGETGEKNESGRQGTFGSVRFLFNALVCVCVCSAQARLWPMKNKTRKNTRKKRFQVDASREKLFCFLDVSPRDCFFLSLPSGNYWLMLGVFSDFAFFFFFFVF